ncbi:galactokinase [Chryseobacterium sp. Leaf180]|uniref:galactokinase n=1 Tax=Chryseobacterium sp. Leaf180 TaxID=1736289 RepID=UPI0006F94CA9|nr:galactokinase [Chryseobacterium sp. Leaf180]KQR94351.1 galactokinase [Chryseobacterium sp. Leaf180]
MSEQLISATKSAFKKQFSSNAERVFLAPGRINVIGEHVDYSDGFVLPASIDKYICFVVKASGQNEKSRFFAADFDDEFSFDIYDKLVPAEKHWANYLLGVCHAMKQRGAELKSFQIAFSSNIPMGSGLSSSAALECGFAFILNDLFSLNFTKKELALIGQQAEHEFVGVKCGIMDQFASVFGKKDHVMMLDCHSLNHKYFPAELGDFELVLFDSCVKHSHLTSGYNDRRKDVEAAKKIINEKYPQVLKFRDTTFEMLNNIKEEIGEQPYLRTFYILKEIKRVEAAAVALSKGNMITLGNLLTETHEGLSKEFEVSCDELDFLVSETSKNKGVLGARMMGGGFGGCSINLIKKDAVDRVSENIKELYLKEFGIEMKVYPVKISDGIKECTDDAI